MLYSKELLNEINKNTKKYIAFSVISFLVFLTPFVFLCFYITDFNFILITTINSILLSCFSIIQCYLILNFFLPSNRRKKTINLIINGKSKIVKYEKFVIGSIRTINHTEKVYEIKLINDEKEFFVLLDVNYDKLLNEFNAHSAVKIINNYVVEFVDEKGI